MLKKMVMGQEVIMSEEEEKRVRAQWAEEDRLTLLNSWRGRRTSLYPRIEDQLDMLYKDKINGTNLWAELITQIKLDNPKPEMK